jgi:hypothetical protein
MAIFTTMAAAAGGAKVLSGLAGARNDAQGMLDSGRDTLLTTRYNINKRKMEAQYDQMQTLEQGQKVASQIQTGAMQAEAKAKAAGGASGAVVDGGTPQAVLSNIAQEGLHAEMGAILNTRNQMKAIKRNTDNQNKSEWNQATTYADEQRRNAKRTIDNSRMQAVADVAETVANVYSAGTAGGTKAFTWGLQGAKVASDVKGISDARHRGGSRHQNPRAKIINPGRKYNPNRRQGSRVQKFPVISGSRKTSGVGKMYQPLGKGQMRAKGWSWNKRTKYGNFKSRGSSGGSHSWYKTGGAY